MAQLVCRLLLCRSPNREAEIETDPGTTQDYMSLVLGSMHPRSQRAD